MKITEKELQRLCEISRFPWEKAKSEQYLNDLNIFLAAAETATEISAEEPSFFSGLSREDVPGLFKERENLFREAAETEDGFYVVPAVAE